MPDTRVPRHLCPYCEDYDTAGENYCRMCGAHLKAGNPPAAEVKTLYKSWEKFCGYCGNRRADCQGKHRRS